MKLPLRKYLLLFFTIGVFYSAKAQDRLWATGTAVPNGSQELIKAPNGNFKFAGTLKQGKLKIITT